MSGVSIAVRCNPANPPAATLLIAHRLKVGNHGGFFFFWFFFFVVVVAVVVVALIPARCTQHLCSPSAFFVAD